MCDGPRGRVDWGLSDCFLRKRTHHTLQQIRIYVAIVIILLFGRPALKLTSAGKQTLAPSKDKLQLFEELLTAHSIKYCGSDTLSFRITWIVFPRICWVIFFNRFMRKLKKWFDSTIWYHCWCVWYLVLLLHLISFHVRAYSLQSQV